MSKVDPELEKIFRSTDTLISHLASELGRTEPECVMAMITWLEERQKTQYCRITVPKTPHTVSAALVLEDAGIVFDTYGTTGGDPNTFLLTLELYDGDRKPIKQVHDVISAALEGNENLMDLFEVHMDSCPEAYDAELPFNRIH